MLDLDAVEIRVLGCLMEKETTTPDNYPLTVNSLMLACNQTTNREPIMHVGESTVTTALTSLRERRLTRIVYSPTNRAPKHRHVAHEQWRLEPGQQAVLCVLALRGPQTPGELKLRTERQHHFADLDAVEEALQSLAAREEPLVQQLGRRPGQKEVRWVHLLAGPVAMDAFDDRPFDQTPSGSRADRIAELSAQVDGLELQTRALAAELAGRVEALEHQVTHLSSVVDRLRALLD